MVGLIFFMLSQFSLAQYSSGEVSINETPQLGFSTSSFKSNDLRGHLSISCIDGRLSSTICRADVLFPVEFDYFYGPKGIKADTIQLTAVHQDGSRRTKSESYKSDLGRSKGRFNLWIVSLTQRPLLEFGQNQITYKLLSGDQVADQGTFVVEVIAGPSLRCPNSHYFENIPGNCNTPSVLCDRYFYENNYCQ